MPINDELECVNCHAKGFYPLCQQCQLEPYFFGMNDFLKAAVIGITLGLVVLVGLFIAAHPVSGAKDDSPICIIQRKSNGWEREKYCYENNR